MLAQPDVGSLAVTPPLASVMSNHNGPAFRPLTLLAPELEEPLLRCPTSDVLCRGIGTVEAAPTVRKWPQRQLALRHVRFCQDCADDSAVSETAAHSPERLESYRIPPMTRRASLPHSSG